MECEGSHFSTEGHFFPPGLGVMTRFLQTKNAYGEIVTTWLICIAAMLDAR